MGGLLETSMATTDTILLEAVAEDISSIDLFSKTHEYKGVTMFEMAMPEIYESLKTWETRPDDVYVITYPKSGISNIFPLLC